MLLLIGVASLALLAEVTQVGRLPMPLASVELGKALNLEKSERILAG